MRPADRPSGGLRHAEVLHLAGLDEFLDRARDILDGHQRIDPVLVVQIDDLHTQPLQRAVDDLFDDLRAAGDPPPRFPFD
jgi:hypothetical protein